MKNKNGQGSGLTWFVAFVIIFFLMLVFIALVSGIAVKRINLFGERGIEVQSEKDLGSMEMQRVLMTFLNYPVNFKDKKTIYNLIKESEITDKEAGKVFGDVALEFFKMNFPKGSSKGGSDFLWRVRIYKSGEKFVAGDVSANFRAGGSSCDLTEDLFSVINIGDKKATLCVSKSYYSK